MTPAELHNERHLYCYGCQEVVGYDEDGVCSKCDTDNTVSFTDEEAREWAGLSRDRNNP